MLEFIGLIFIALALHEVATELSRIGAVYGALDRIARALEKRE